jgi:hypothetical protein
MSQNQRMLSKSFLDPDDWPGIRLGPPSEQGKPPPWAGARQHGAKDMQQTLTGFDIRCRRRCASVEHAGVDCASEGNADYKNDGSDRSPLLFPSFFHPMPQQLNSWNHHYKHYITTDYPHHKHAS